MKYSIKLLTIALLSINAGHASKDLNLDPKSTVSAKIVLPKFKEPVPHVKAKERLELTKRICDKTPDITMLTKVTGLKELFYRDHQFVLYRMRDSKSFEMQAMEMRDLANFVERTFKSSMSFADYNFLSQEWIRILMSDTRVEDLGKLYKSFSDYCKGVSECKTRLQKIYRWIYCTSGGLVLPHVSPTGSVPIRIMNCGFGFKTMPNGRFGSLSMLAIPTRSKNKFDYLEDESIEDTWYHDYDHNKRNGLLVGFESSSRKSYNSLVKVTANLLERLRKLPGIQRRQGELAFFHVFHEGQKCNQQFMNTINSSKRYVEKLISEEIRVSKTGFSSLKQYQTYTKGALHLKLPINTLKGFEMKSTKDYKDKKTKEEILFEYRQELRHRLRGLEILDSIVKTMYPKRVEGQTDAQRIVQLAELYKLNCITSKQFCEEAGGVVLKAYREPLCDKFFDAEYMSKYYKERREYVRKEFAKILGEKLSASLHI